MTSKDRLWTWSHLAVAISLSRRGFVDLRAASSMIRVGRHGRLPTWSTERQYARSSAQAVTRFACRLSNGAPGGHERVLGNSVRQRVVNLAGLINSVDLSPYLR